MDYCTQKNHVSFFFQMEVLFRGLSMRMRCTCAIRLLSVFQKGTAYSCGRVETIRKRSMWTQTFLKTKKKFSKGKRTRVRVDTV